MWFHEDLNSTIAFTCIYFIFVSPCLPLSLLMCLSIYLSIFLSFFTISRFLPISLSFSLALFSSHLLPLPFYNTPSLSLSISRFAYLSLKLFEERSIFDLLEYRCSCRQWWFHRLLSFTFFHIKVFQKIKWDFFYCDFFITIVTVIILSPENYSFKTIVLRQIFQFTMIGYTYVSRFFLHEAYWNCINCVHVLRNDNKLKYDE